MLKRLVGEPLVHFVAIALIIFAVYSLMNEKGLSPRPRIEVNAAKIEQLAGLFARSWQRPPTAEELKGLIDDYLDEEIYYREAKALGLDSDDTVIRRRLRLKMELLNDAAVDQLSPTDAELNAYLAAHAADYRVEPAAAFEQVFLSPDKHGAALAADASALLDALRKGSVSDPATAGDSTLLPQKVNLTSQALIGRDFGDEFAAAVVELSVNIWSGPVQSAYGVHLVRVTDKTARRAPPLSDVRDAVLRDWKSAKGKEIAARRLAQFAKHYDIVVDPVLGDASGRSQP